jgi:hypothetical protein
MGIDIDIEFRNEWNSAPFRSVFHFEIQNTGMNRFPQHCLSFRQPPLKKETTVFVPVPVYCRTRKSEMLRRSVFPTTMQTKEKDEKRGYCIVFSGGKKA